ncbi:hypothetical protein Ddye_008629 [Dipteronia dyeriana]|uniref:Uncharacterized protein n=1 Tax=Dipteronia dyeriana TaxID=168575 RepID=A0AAD9XA83_9ROSI|nr:hypothetical protein Ddye_008629 [Dipteronia dyeriana]
MTGCEKLSKLSDQGMVVDSDVSEHKAKKMRFSPRDLSAFDCKTNVVTSASLDQYCKGNSTFDDPLATPTEVGSCEKQRAGDGNSSRKPPISTEYLFNALSDDLCLFEYVGSSQELKDDSSTQGLEHYFNTFSMEKIPCFSIFIVAGF